MNAFTTHLFYIWFYLNTGTVNKSQFNMTYIFFNIVVNPTGIIIKSHHTDLHVQAHEVILSVFLNSYSQK